MHVAAVGSGGEAAAGRAVSVEVCGTRGAGAGLERVVLIVLVWDDKEFARA